MKSPLLSIIIPTYNRAEILRYTLSLFKDQILRNIEDVEFIVCSNACTDNTIDVINDLQKECDFIQLYNYKDHVDIGNSIKRSADNAHGKYFILWSDDDIPGPMMIDQICIKLKEYPGIGCLSFARLNGTSYGNDDLRRLFVFTPSFNKYDKYYNSSSDFVRDHYSEMDFLSINVILKDAWVKGLSVDTSTHFGFDFLAPILVGIQGYECLFLEFPMCIKRDVQLKDNSYTYKWPLYAYIGIPHILQCLQENGVINDWRQLFANYRYNIKDSEFMANILTFCYAHPDFYAPYIKELEEYQTDPFRRKVVRAISGGKLLKSYIKIEFLLRRIMKRLSTYLK